MWVVINNGKIIWLPNELYAVDVKMAVWLKHQWLMRRMNGASDRVVTVLKLTELPLPRYSNADVENLERFFSTLKLLLIGIQLVNLRNLSFWRDNCLDSL